MHDMMALNEHNAFDLHGELFMYTSFFYFLLTFCMDDCGPTDDEVRVPFFDSLVYVQHLTKLIYLISSSLPRARNVW